MANYAKVSIDITENGYIVTGLYKNQGSGKQYVFKKASEMRKWLKDNLAPTGEVKRFSDALDNESEDDTIDPSAKLDMLGYLRSTFSISSKDTSSV